MPDSKSSDSINLSSSSRFIPWIVAAAFFMENLDGTVIITALPQIADSLGVNAVNMSMGVTAYLITLAVFIPVSGWMADRFGARTVFGSAIAIFTLASMLCGLSQTMDQFIAARILQGFGGAMMVPVGRLIVLRNASKSELVKMIAIITWPGLMAPIIGQPLGGFITTFTNWRWIFFLNIPIGLLGILCVIKLISNQVPTQKRPLDWIGFFVIGVGLASFMFGIESLSTVGISQTSIGSCLIGFGLMSFAVWYAKRHPYPLLDFSAFKIPTYAITIYFGSLSRIMIGATPFLAPLMFQLAFGYTAFESGLLFLSAMLGNLALKPITSTILKQFGFRNVMVGNACLAAIATILSGFLTADTSIWIICLVMLFYGLTRSMQFTCIQALAFSDMPSEKMSSANTVFSTVAQLNMGIGVALGAILIHFTVWWHGGDIANPSGNDFQWAFFIIGILMLISLLGYLKLKPDAGHQVSGHVYKP